MDKRKTTIVVVALLALGVGAVEAFTFWTSQVFTKSVSVSATFEAFCNVEDATDIYYDTGWQYDQITTTDSLLAGDLVRILINARTKNTGNDAYIRLTATGDYVTSGGVIGATIQRMEISSSGGISAVGSPIVVSDVNAMSATLLTDIAKNGPMHPFVEITLSFDNGSLGWGDFSADVQILMGDSDL